jgi:hypothetical protein
MREGLDPAVFELLLAEIVANDPPRLFAVVQELGERVDARVAAWGMAFEDHAELVGVDRQMRASLGKPEDALFLFRSGERIQARLVWV